MMKQPQFNLQFKLAAQNVCFIIEYSPQSMSDGMLIYELKASNNG